MDYAQKSTQSGQIVAEVFQGGSCLERSGVLYVWTGNGLQHLPESQETNSQDVWLVNLKYRQVWRQKAYLLNIKATRQDICRDEHSGGAVPELIDDVVSHALIKI